MRRTHYTAQPGLEAFIDFADREILSSDEVAISMEEAANLAVSVRSDLKEIDRVDEVAHALEQLADLASGITIATAVECRLMEIAGDMAVAGSDLNPEAVIPSMEEFVGKTISVESIRTTAKTIWETIKRILKQIWESIESFFFRMFNSFPRLLKDLEKTKERIKDIGTKKLRQTGNKDFANIELGTGVNALSVKYKVVQNGKALEDALTTFDKHADMVYHDYSKWVEQIGTGIKKAFDDFDSANEKKSYNDIRAAVSGSIDMKIRAVSNAEPLIGNVTLGTKSDFKVEEQKNIVSSFLNQIGALRVELVSTPDNTSISAGERKVKFSIEAFTPAEMTKIVDTMIKTIKTVEEFERNTYKKLVSLRKDIEKSADKTTTAPAKANPDATSVTDGVEELKALYRFPTIFAHWVESPFMGFTRHVATTARAVSLAVNKSIALYE